MTEGSPPTNFIFTFQSIARKQNHLVWACCTWFPLWQLVSLSVFWSLQLPLCINFILFFLFFNSWGSDRLSYPDPYALLLLRSDFFRYARNSNLPANVIDKALVIQHLLFYDDRLGTMFARVDTASLQLAVPELPSEVISRSCSSQNICCF